MPIIKIRRENKYAQIANTTLRDKRLSLDTRGFLGEMLSYSVDFDVTVEWLMENFNIGRDKLLRITQELKTHGYLVTPGVKNEQGQFTGKEWIFYAEPRYGKTEETVETVIRETRTTGKADEKNAKQILDTKQISSDLLHKSEDAVAVSLPEKGKRYFRDFTEQLTRYGQKEQSARAALAKLKNTYGDEMVFTTYFDNAALLETKEGGAFEYFVGILKRTKAEQEIASQARDRQKTKDEKFRDLVIEQSNFYKRFTRPTLNADGSASVKI